MAENTDEGPWAAQCNDCGEVKHEVWFRRYTRCSHCQGTSFTFKKYLNLDLPPNGPVSEKHTF